MGSDAVGTIASDWAERLGQEHCARDESAARLATSQQEDAAQATAVSVERWVTIVAAIRRLTDAYNARANRVVLSVVEQSGEPTVTVAAGGEGAPYVTAALDDTLICMRACDALGIPHATEFRLRSDRGDDATAAYLLQNASLKPSSERMTSGPLGLGRISDVFSSGHYARHALA